MNATGIKNTKQQRKQRKLETKMDLWIYIMIWIAGILVGLITGLITSIIINKKLTMKISSCKKTLQKIARHQWYISKQNDAIIITRMVIRELKNK